MNNCYRHPERETYISCQRCERFICPECMNDAAVGFQCPECISSAHKAVRRPRATATRSMSLILIAINVVIAVLVLLTGGSTSPLFQKGAMLTQSALTNQGEWLRGFLDGAWWRPFTSAFLHSGIAHLAFNMFAIYVFGPMLESVLGRARFLAVYAISILGASTAVLYLSAPNALTVGASGAVYGLFAVALVVLIKARQDVQFLLFLLAINIAISFTGSISWQAHLGGFLAGGLLGWYYAYSAASWRAKDRIVTGTLAVVLILGLYGPLILA